MGMSGSKKEFVTNNKGKDFKRQFEMLDAIQLVYIVHHCRLIHKQKTMPKRTVAEIDCSSFDQLDLQSLNDCKFFFFVEALTIFLGILGHVIDCYNVLENTFPTVCYTPRNV